MAEKSEPQDQKKIPLYLKAMSGSLGGIVKASCLQLTCAPIEVIKTRLQLDRSGNYKGIIHWDSTIVRDEDVWALWKGLTTHLTHKYALQMGSNAVLQSVFKDSETRKLSP
ncbi:unnamed protein product [Coffea canephora]|uniref:ADP/ATP translocase n=1 Tax=Coffea canephora TaxID=49390 RepID=A0A068UQX7_COFCA|nr:unnamed protein product [Coffea canephora]